MKNFHIFYNNFIESYDLDKMRKIFDTFLKDGITIFCALVTNQICTRLQFFLKNYNFLYKNYKFYDFYIKIS